ncbi:MAG TPA: N-acetylmuramoyl-L-alanine amidase [Acidimicrobiales bacterium]|nr:N-acetylmuramoyl-L-alanine amidase [Acidimicrobiales bacterium]
MGTAGWTSDARPTGSGPSAVRPVVLVVAVILGVAGLVVPVPTAGGLRPGPTRVRAAASVPTSDHVAVGIATDRVTGGYWIATSDGSVFAFDAPSDGSLTGRTLSAPVVAIAATNDGGGYWLAAADGGVFAFGDAGYAGSMGGTPLVAPIVGMAATPDGGGYWLVAADGGVFTFGDAAYAGSMGGRPLVQPVVAMAATADGGGYWLVAADGGVFTFGDAVYAGSMGGTPLHYPVVGLAADPATGGYWEVAADGGVFNFGAPFLGSVGGDVLARAVVGMAPTADGAGYLLVGADGGLYGLGDALYQGTVDVLPLAGLVVTLDPGHDGGNGADPASIDQPIDGGGFTEPCDTAGTTTADGYTEHAFNFDVATRAQVLLEAEGASVVLTRPDDTGVGPCVDVRAAIGNFFHSAAAVSIHADGGPPDGRGFTVITPAPVVSSISNNTAIVPASDELGADLRNTFAADTAEQTSDYDGQNGLDARDNLGGLNLSTVPKVLIECANMQNGVDATLVEDPAWRQQAAQGIADGVTAFLTAEELA